jgi:hypothetical protein
MRYLHQGQNHPHLQPVELILATLFAGVATIRVKVLEIQLDLSAFQMHNS